MKDNWIVSAFYTRDTSYKDVAEKYLLPSLARLGIHCDLSVVEDRGSWLANIAHKPEVIEKTLNRYKPAGVNVVYLDVDASVEAYPGLFGVIPKEHDIAFHLLDRVAWYGLKNAAVSKEYFNGTIFFRNNEKARAFVSGWKEKCKDYKTWEPTWFKQIIESTDIKCFDLPLSYAYIASLPDGSRPRVQVEYVHIKHHQASRKYRGRD